MKVWFNLLAFYEIVIAVLNVGYQIVSNRAQRATFLLVLVPILLFSSSCGETTATVGVSYTPPFAPVTFTVDSNGTIMVQGNLSIETPVGQFALEANVADTLQAQDNTLFVIIRHNLHGRIVDDVYKIQTGQDEVRVTTNGTTTVDITQHKVFIDASKGSIKSIEVKGVNQQSTPPNTPVAQSTTTHVYHTSLNAVNSVAWSPDSKYIAVGGASGDSVSPTIEILDAFNGKVVLTYKGHPTLVYALAWSADGKYIASAGYDYTVQVWEAFTGKKIATLKPGDAVNTLAWSPNGKYLAFGGYAYPYDQVWDVTTGQQVSTYTGHAGCVDSLSWSPDGQDIVSSGCEHTVQVWKALTGEHIFTYNSSGEAPVVAWSPDGKRIASSNECCYDGAVRIWKPFTGDMFLTYKGSITPKTLSWSPNGKFIASTADDWKVWVWNTTTGANVLIYSGQPLVRTVAWSPNGKYIASGGDDGTVQIWNAPSG
jgi:WD40 repeat protein